MTTYKTRCTSVGASDKNHKWSVVAVDLITGNWHTMASGLTREVASYLATRCQAEEVHSV